MEFKRSFGGYVDTNKSRVFTIDITSQHNANAASVDVGETLA